MAALGAHPQQFLRPYTIPDLERWSPATGDPIVKVSHWLAQTQIAPVRVAFVEDSMGLDCAPFGLDELAARADLPSKRHFGLTHLDVGQAMGAQ